VKDRDLSIRDMLYVWNNKKKDIRAVSDQEKKE
jgi:hypothetical protein